MKTHKFIQKIFIPSFHSIVYPYIKNSVFEHMQANIDTSLDGDVLSYKCILKLETCFRHHTAHLQRVFQQKQPLTVLCLSFSFPTWLNRIN